MKKIISMVLGVILVSGCMTSKLFEERVYTEAISSILVTSDRSRVVFVSDDYHYIFQAPKLLTDSFDAPYRRSLKAEFYTFKVSRSERVEGHFKLVVPAFADEQAKRAAEEAGFKCSADLDQSEYCRADVELVGTRYAANRDLPIGDLQSLNQSYKVHVSADEGAGAKILLTPVTLAADGVIVIGAVGLFTALMFVCASEPNGCK